MIEGTAPAVGSGNAAQNTEQATLANSVEFLNTNLGIATGLVEWTATGLKFLE